MEELMIKLGILEEWKKDGEKKSGIKGMHLPKGNIDLRIKEVKNFLLRDKLMKEQNLMAKQMKN